ncbi:uncharacterized protein LOC129409402 [Boleophthalmus pectinirostris]|uniref:uncharacterized protein LOC129409402 n=1 Tax=Boleophthalmus pectinirostris TaxID=150288 RepID=UPI00242B8EFA|nr:uncharacterized protein LOC129409402 [Boleophthalmus pectinirostris]
MPVTFSFTLSLCIFLSVFVRPIPTKERDAGAVAVGELDVDPPHPSSAQPGFDSDDNYTLSDQDYYEDREETTDSAPWEKRYEKLWVDVEKREVKTTYKSVTAELKARFGELFKSRRSGTDDDEEEEEEEEEEKEKYEPAPETSSDEDEGDVVVRPIARARQTSRLLTIPEQRESGLEDSESADNSVCEQVSNNSRYEQGDPEEDDEKGEASSPSPRPRKITTASEGSSFAQLVPQDFTEENQARTASPSPTEDGAVSPEDYRPSSPPLLQDNAPKADLNVNDEAEI